MRKAVALLVSLAFLTASCLMAAKPALSSADVTENSWVSKAPMHQARSRLGAAAVNGKIYAIGGNAENGIVGTNEEYDPATDTWIQKTPATYNSLGRATAALDGKIYVLSGSFDNLVTTMNQIYDTQTDTWTFGSSAPTYFMSGSAIATTGLMAPKRIYVFDKPSPDLAVNPNAPLYSTQVYDPETDSWMAGADLPTSRAEVAVAIINDKIYVIGGYSATYDNLPYDYTPKITQYRTVEQYTPFGYGSVPPAVCITSLESMATYASSDVPLNFSLNKPAAWVGYSLDGRDNVTVTDNTTISALANGLHNVTVYAKDTFGNVGFSETVSFSVEVPFPATLVIAPVAGVVLVGAVLAIYFKKRNRQAENDLVKKP
jgi:hypothetical protein